MVSIIEMGRGKKDGLRISGRRDSNPLQKLGRLLCYRYTTPATVCDRKLGKAPGVKLK